MTLLIKPIKTHCRAVQCVASSSMFVWSITCCNPNGARSSCSAAEAYSQEAESNIFAPP